MASPRVFEPRFELSDKVDISASDRSSDDSEENGRQVEEEGIEPEVPTSSQRLF